MTAAILVASAVPTLPQAPPLRKRESRHTSRRRSNCKQGNHFGQVQHHYNRRGANSCNYTCTNSNDSGGSEESRSAQRISDGPRAQVRTGSGVELGDGTDNSGATRSCENGCNDRLSTPAAVVQLVRPSRRRVFVSMRPEGYLSRKTGISQAQPEGKTRGEADCRRPSLTRLSCQTTLLTAMGKPNSQPSPTTHPRLTKLIDLTEQTPCMETSPVTVNIAIRRENSNLTSPKRTPRVSTRPGRTTWTAHRA